MSSKARSVMLHSSSNWDLSCGQRRPCSLMQVTSDLELDSFQADTATSSCKAAQQLTLRFDPDLHRFRQMLPKSVAHLRSIWCCVVHKATQQDSDASQ